MAIIIEALENAVDNNDWETVNQILNEMDKED